LSWIWLELLSGGDEEEKITIRKVLVGLLALLGAVTLSLIGYSFFGLHNTQGLILREGQSLFLQAGESIHPETEAPRLGYLAPDFRLTDLGGQARALSDYRGKPLLLNFWASWCPPCRAEMPDLERFYQLHGDQIGLLGVNWGESQATVLVFLTKLKISYPSLLDEGGTAFVKYQLTGIPTSFFIDAQGLIRGMSVGPMSTEQIEAGFARLQLQGGNER